MRDGIDLQQLAHYEQKLSYEIDSWDLWDALRQGQEVVVVDARGPDAFAKERIPGAISMPHRTMSEETTASWSRSALYVCYCDGIGCNASTKGARNLTRLGFRVRELIGGLDWWKRDGYETHGAAARPGTAVTCAC